VWIENDFALIFDGANEGFSGSDCGPRARARIRLLQAAIRCGPGLALELAKAE